MNPKIDAFFSDARRWKIELEELRRIMLECPLMEELKWGVPCDTFQQKNIVIIHSFKEYCAVLFIKGSLLKDEHGLLIRQTEQTQAGRQIRFSSLRAIQEIEAVIKSYVLEAIEIERVEKYIAHILEGKGMYD